MKVNVIGVKRIEGTAKASGLPFDMCRLYCTVPIETGGAKTKVSGYGLEVAEMELEANVLPTFAQVKFPAELELKVDQRFQFGEFRSVVTGFDANAARPMPAKVA